MKIKNGGVFDQNCWHLKVDNEVFSYCSGKGFLGGEVGFVVIFFSIYTKRSRGLAAAPGG